MARKIVQIIAVRDQTWMVRILLCQHGEAKKRTYYNGTIHGYRRQTQQSLSGKHMH